jgi:hypothetical protein
MFKGFLSYLLAGMIFIPFLMMALFIRRNGGSSVVEHSVVFVGYVVGFVAHRLLRKDCE